MIFDYISNADHYLGIDANLDIALKDMQQATFECRREIKPGEVICNVSEYETKLEGKYETHLAFADIHLVTSGSEILRLGDPATQKEFERREQDDYVGTMGESAVDVVLHPGQFLMLFPEEAHMVCIANGEPAHVNKVVYKIKMK